MIYTQKYANKEQIKNFINKLNDHINNCDSCKWGYIGFCDCNCKECKNFRLQYLTISWSSETKKLETRIEIHSGIHQPELLKAVNTHKELYKNCDSGCVWVFYDDYKKIRETINNKIDTLN